jgi:hypothetical protein
MIWDIYYAAVNKTLNEVGFSVLVVDQTYFLVYKCVIS